MVLTIFYHPGMTSCNQQRIPTGIFHSARSMSSCSWVIANLALLPTSFILIKKTWAGGRLNPRLTRACFNLTYFGDTSGRKSSFPHVNPFLLHWNQAFSASLLIQFWVYEIQSHQPPTGHTVTFLPSWALQQLSSDANSISTSKTLDNFAINHWFAEEMIKSNLDCVSRMKLNQKSQQGFPLLSSIPLSG